MVGTVQVQCCKNQVDLTIRRNLPSSSESNKENPTSNKTGSKKICRQEQTEGSDDEICSVQSKCRTPPCSTSSGGQANGVMQHSCRELSNYVALASHKERSRQISEDLKKRFGKDSSKSDASCSSRASVRQMVLRSIGQNNYIRSAHSGNSSLNNTYVDSLKTSCTRSEGFVMKVSDDAVYKAPAQLTEDKLRDSSNSKVSCHEECSANVNQKILTGDSGKSTQQLFASDGQFLSQVATKKKRLDDMTAKFTTDNATHVKSPKSDGSASNVNKTKGIRNPLPDGSTSFIINSAISDPSKQEVSKSNVRAMGQLPRVPEQPCYDVNCGCNISTHPKGCCRKLCTCSTVQNINSPPSRDASGTEIYGGNVANITESDVSSRDTVEVGEAGVQTSFASVQQIPCSPSSCPKRKRAKVPKLLVSKVVQTESSARFVLKTDDSKTTLAPKKITKSTPVKLTIPRKRSSHMEDRLQRRIMYFDSNPSSVCNKDVEFCSYRIHRSKKTLDPEKHSTPIKVDKKAKNALSVRRLGSDEIAIEVVSLQLSAQVVAQLLKSSFFVYVDYVFLGHVGNETYLAPISETIHFDSRISYCVSMKFCRKERSILREQINPTGLLAKDTVMFILVCQAAPEYDMLKNWDFAYGYLPLKSLLEISDKADDAKLYVEMNKIGSTARIGTLTIIFEGLELLKTIRDEDIECVEESPGHVLSKFAANKRAIKDLEHNR